MIKTKRLSIRRVRADDWKAIQGIWADAAKSTFSQFDKPNSLDNLSVSRRIKNGLLLRIAINICFLPCA